MPQLQLSGMRHHYRWDGADDAPVLLLSHSLGTTLEMWNPQMSAFAARFRVLRYDCRGHGDSDVPAGPYSLAQMGGDVLAMLDALELQRVHFCGLSMGGMIGMWLACEAPERIARLALCNTAAHIGPPEVWNQRIEAVARGGMEAVSEAVLARWFTDQFRAARPQSVAAVREMLLRTDPKGYMGACAAVRDMDLTDALSRIRAPTLIVTGRFDPATPPDTGDELRARIAGARVVSLAASHLSNIEAAEDFNHELLMHLGAENQR